MVSTDHPATSRLTILVSILQTAHIWANTGVFRQLYCGVHDKLHISSADWRDLWHRHQIEGTNVF